MRFLSLSFVLSGVVVGTLLSMSLSNPIRSLAAMMGCTVLGFVVGFLLEVRIP